MVFFDIQSKQVVSEVNISYHRGFKIQIIAKLERINVL